MHSECSEREGNGGGPPFPPHSPPWPGLLGFIWQTRDDGQNWIRKLNSLRARGLPGPTQKERMGRLQIGVLWRQRLRKL